jgi:hypothetical protein
MHRLVETLTIALLPEGMFGMDLAARVNLPCGERSARSHIFQTYCGRTLWLRAKRLPGSY